MVTVTVRNEDGVYARGLSRENFEVAVEKEVCAIQSFEAADSPISIGILVDTSGSMTAFERDENPQGKSLGEAIFRFIKSRNPDDEFFVIGFDSTTRLISDWTNGKSLVSQTTTIPQHKVGTALYDACFTAIEKFQTARHRKRALVLISDGEDTRSRHTFRQLRDLLKRSDLLFYVIGTRPPNGSEISMDVNPESSMSELAALTGAEAKFSLDRKQLGQVIDDVATQLRHQYRLGILGNKLDPSNKWQPLKIRIKWPNAPKDFRNLRIAARQGYYSR